MLRRVASSCSSSPTTASCGLPEASRRVTWCSVWSLHSARLRSVMSIVVPRQTPPSLSGSSSFALVSAQRSRSEEHTSELQSLRHLVCRLLLEKKKKETYDIH